MDIKMNIKDKLEIIRIYKESKTKELSFDEDLEVVKNFYAMARNEYEKDLLRLQRAEELLKDAQQFIHASISTCKDIEEFLKETENG